MSVYGFSLLASLAGCGEPPPLEAGVPAERPHADPDTPPDAVAPQVILPVTGLSAAQLGIVVNTDDPLSAEVAARYAAARGLTQAQIVTVSLGSGTDVSAEVFEVAQARVREAFGEDIQALLLAFPQPYRVACMGASAAFALGFDARFCQDGPPCRTTAPSPLYDTETVTPFTDFGVRPTMMLSGSSLEEVDALLARGLAAMDSDPHGDVHLLRTTDGARSVRWEDFERTAGRFDPEAGLRMAYVDSSGDASTELLRDAEGVLGYQTGLTQVGALETVRFLPGALADHLTSFGGVLDGSAGQMPATEWLRAGATASYGTAIEPCNYPEKFPRASVLWPAYFRGATAVEAYWRSVEWPGEGNFVGDPLARPFGHRVEWEGDTLRVTTPWPDRRARYRLEAADAAQGPWETVLDGIEGGNDHRRHVLELPRATRAFYRLVAAEG